MPDLSAQLDQLVDAVRKSAGYRSVCENLIRKIGARELAKQRSRAPRPGGHEPSRAESMLSSSPSSQKSWQTRAKILDKTEGAIKSLQHRALASLQKQIAQKN